MEPPQTFGEETDVSRRCRAPGKGQALLPVADKPLTLGPHWPAPHPGRAGPGSGPHLGGSERGAAGGPQSSCGRQPRCTAASSLAGSCPCKDTHGAPFRGHRAAVPCQEPPRLRLLPSSKGAPPHAGGVSHGGPSWDGGKERDEAPTCTTNKPSPAASLERVLLGEGGPHPLQRWGQARLGGPKLPGASGQEGGPVVTGAAHALGPCCVPGVCGPQRHLHCPG